MSSLVAVVCGRNVEALVFGSGSTVVVNARSELPRSKSRRVVYMCLYEALASKSKVINRNFRTQYYRFRFNIHYSRSN